MKFAVLAITFFALLGVVLSEYSEQIDALYSLLGTCVTRTESAKSSITTVKSRFDKITGSIQDVRDIKDDVSRVDSSLDTMNSLLSLASYIPGINIAAAALKTTVSAIRTPVRAAKRVTSTLDSALYPWKARIDPVSGILSRGIGVLGRINDACETGESIVGEVKNCTDYMSSGNGKKVVENGLQIFADSLNDPLIVLNGAVGGVGSVARGVEQVTAVAEAWPTIRGIRNAVASFTGAIDPILEFFEKVRRVLEKELCIPNPLELIAEIEIVEEVAEAVQSAARKAAEVAENGRETAANLINVRRWRLRLRRWGKRRRRSPAYQHEQLLKVLKRSLSDITVSEEEANALIRSKRASSICFSIKDILDGLDSIFGSLLDKATDAISDLLSFKPSFSLPALPDFGTLDQVVKFNLPSLDFGFNFTLFSQFESLSLRCISKAISVCRAGSGDLTVCGQTAAAYKSSTSSQSKQIGSLSQKQITNEYADKVLVHLPPAAKRVRKDDKKMTMAQVKETVSSLSSEGKMKLLARLKEMGVEVPRELQVNPMNSVELNVKRSPDKMLEQIAPLNDE